VGDGALPYGPGLFFETEEEWTAGYPDPRRVALARVPDPAPPPPPDLGPLWAALGPPAPAAAAYLAGRGLAAAADLCRSPDLAALAPAIAAARDRRGRGQAFADLAPADQLALHAAGGYILALSIRDAADRVVGIQLRSLDRRDRTTMTIGAAGSGVFGAAGAVAGAAVVVLAEGLTDTLAATIATTSDAAAVVGLAGAGSWRAALGLPLAGKRVIIAFDADKAGDAAAAGLVAALADSAACYRARPAAPDKDCCDALARAPGALAALLGGAAPFAAPLAPAARAPGPNGHTHAHAPPPHDAPPLTDADAPPDEGGSGKGRKGPGPSAGSRLALMVRGDLRLWHAPDGIGHATLEDEDHSESWPLDSAACRTYLRRRWFFAHRAALSKEAVGEAIATLDMFARDAAGRPWLRTAEHGDDIYIDLCDAEWRAIRVTAAGWAVVRGPLPVAFVRTPGMIALPAPARGGSVDLLREVANIPDGDEFKLVAAWLLAALRPSGPYPILCLHGEQGSAKSSAARAIRGLVDPSTIPLRSEPKENRDLFINAKNSWCISLENLSYLEPWLSDALCGLSTGNGFATRSLYSNDEEVLFVAARPQILNGITDVAARGDLVDRALILQLPPIAEAGRRTEKELWARYDQVRPLILGALCDGLQAAIARLPHTAPEHNVRMADFAAWATAAEPALGWRPGAFMEAYRRNRRDASEGLLEDSLLVGPIRAIAAAVAAWEGTSTALLAEMARHSTEAAMKEKTWPKSPRALSAALRRIAPAMRASGLHVDHPKGTKKLWIVRQD
jgi:hypothetical protein